MTKLARFIKNLVWRFRMRELLKPRYFIADKGEVTEKEFLKWQNEQLKNFGGKKY